MTQWLAGYWGRNYTLKQRRKPMGQKFLLQGFPVSNPDFSSSE